MRAVDRSPTVEELARMQQLVEEAMRQGAMGLSTSLIYAPTFYAETDELIALAKAASKPPNAVLAGSGQRLTRSLTTLAR